MRFLNFVMLISATLFLPITGCEEPAEVQVTAELAPTAVYDQAMRSPALTERRVPFPEPWPEKRMSDFTSLWESMKSAVI